MLRESGASRGFRYHDTDMTSATAEDYYTYVKNLQGDIVAVTDESGAVLVEYIYSAYGEFFVEYATTDTEIRTILEYSPFRYRGYIYDEESGFYYLNSGFGRKNVFYGVTS